ncbi:MAG: ParB/RepB/Spo0J family partition protein [Hyphomicrobiaceae bacterium]|nr:ParB/RepB/Spo0J family partition protein [Hyphomicrobiaceae bacterium]MCC0024285.1 ParB/RepB/Spo0J family partition protein [Hyphomicrobiaceae bacterium]
MSDQRTNRLGRGLAALIGDNPSLDAPRLADTGIIKKLPVEFVLANQRNPRRAFDPELLEELANSIREKGIMQPLLVRPSKQDPNLFELIAGERRWRAAQKAGLHEVPVIIREVDDREALELAIIENVQRADLNPVDEAQGYGELIDQFGYTQNDLAQVIGKSRSHVANTLRLLKLPEDVRALLADGSLTAGHARALITAENPSALAQQIVQKGLSVRDAEALGQQRPTSAPRPRSVVAKSADTMALEKELSDLLGLTVVLHDKGESGRIEIRYSTLEQLDDVCNRLRY